MMSKTILRTNGLALLFLAIAISSSGQGDEKSYRAFLSNTNYKELWKKEVEAKQSHTKSDPADSKARYELAIVHLGLLSATMRDKDEKLFDQYYDPAVSNLKTLIDKEKKWAEPKALLSAIYGLKMGYSPWQGMFLGSKSNSLIDKAKELSPQSGLVWKVHANSKLFTPETFGGSLSEAISSFEKSIRCYESNPAELKFNWMYLDALAFLGQAYVKNNEPRKAIETYEKALTVEPEYGWVKYSLLPKAKAKLK